MVPLTRAGPRAERLADRRGPAPLFEARRYKTTHTAGKADCLLCRGAGVSAAGANSVTGLQRDCRCITAEDKAKRQAEVARENALGAVRVKQHKTGAPAL